MRALAAAREPGERRLDVLEGELERVRRERADLAADLAKAKASIHASEQQVHPHARPASCSIMQASHPFALHPH